MTFYDEIDALKNADLAAFFDRITPSKISSVLAKDELRSEDFLTLLSPGAAASLEDMAQIAHRLSLRHFGPTMLLFTPLYLANYCVNHCVYCGFSAGHNIRRRKLTDCPSTG